MTKSEFEFLVRAVIHCESGGDPTAVSSVGAKGLMQLMDSTGRQWHRTLRLDGEYDPFNPSQNERIGRAYLSWLIDHYDKDIPTALAAWNFGIGNIRKIFRSRGLLSFVALFPFLPQETQDFVHRVLDKKESLEAKESVQ